MKSQIGCSNDRLPADMNKGTGREFSEWRPLARPALGLFLLLAVGLFMLGQPDAHAGLAGTLARPASSVGMLPSQGAAALPAGASSTLTEMFDVLTPLAVTDVFIAAAPQQTDTSTPTATATATETPTPTATPIFTDTYEPDVPCPSTHWPA